MTWSVYSKWQLWPFIQLTKVVFYPKNKLKSSFSESLFEMEPNLLKIILIWSSNNFVSVDPAHHRWHLIHILIFHNSPAAMPNATNFGRDGPWMTPPFKNVSSNASCYPRWSLWSLIGWYMLIFHNRTTLQNGTKLWRDSPWCSPHQLSK